MVKLTTLRNSLLAFATNEIKPYKKDKDRKAKVVAAVFGDRLYSIPCSASYFAQKNRMNS